MESKELIEKLLSDLKTYPNMGLDLYSQKCEALRTLYKREDDISHALGINLEMRKSLSLLTSWYWTFMVVQILIMTMVSAFLRITFITSKKIWMMFRGELSICKSRSNARDFCIRRMSFNISLLCKKRSPML